MLGTVFLRNFYTVLDYDNDLIAIGVNKGSSHLAKAEIVGHRANPTIEASGNGVAIFFLVLLIIFLLVGGVYLVLWRRDVVKKRKQ